jgi:hypothetical protein
VPQRMRGNLARELGQLNSSFKCGLHTLHGSAVPLDEMFARNSFRLPTAEMSQKPRRVRHRGLTLLGCASSDRQAAEMPSSRSTNEWPSCLYGEADAIARVARPYRLRHRTREGIAFLIIPTVRRSRSAGWPRSWSAVHAHRSSSASVNCPTTRTRCPTSRSDRRNIILYDRKEK